MTDSVKRKRSPNKKRPSNKLTLFLRAQVPEESIEAVRDAWWRANGRPTHRSERLTEARKRLELYLAEMLTFRLTVRVQRNGALAIGPSKVWLAGDIPAEDIYTEGE